jgi:hypothetical protein
MKSDGTWKKIYDKWLAASLGKAPTPPAANYGRDEPRPRHDHRTGRRRTARPRSARGARGAAEALRYLTDLGLWIDDRRKQLDAIDPPRSTLRTRPIATPSPMT